jgi:phage terminase large subunit-like protein
MVWRQVKSIKHCGFGTYFDLNVPGPENYLAEGMWHHNSGKTRTGAETVREWATDPAARILIVGPTATDIRETMIEGPSGILGCYPPGRKPIYEPSKHQISFPSGAIGITRSGEEPERLRGPQFRQFWIDEICACWDAQAVWDQIMFGFRLPTPDLQGLITTTPKPIDVLKKLLANPNCVVTRGSSYENRANLSPEWFRQVIEPYEGTRLGRQEIEGELLEDTPGALWTQSMIDRTRIAPRDCPPLVRVVVAIDPAVTANEHSDETGIGAAGIAENGHVYVLEDSSCRQTPGAWARTACKLLLKWDGDRIVGEVNNGGDLIEANLRTISAEVPFRAVRATRGKMLRAEPVAAMHERGRIHFVGRDFMDLEAQLTTYVPGMSKRSPDRLDWFVWAVTDLALSPAVQSTTVTVDAAYEISPI